MNILITTGIYPPKIGGPAQYTKNLKEKFEEMGHSVSVKTFSIESWLPSGVRHAFFFIKILPSLFFVEVVYTFDTFSVGMPTVLACKIFRKKCIVRTGGDFLWEQYVERTREKVLLRNFYITEKENLSTKEQIIWKVTRWTLLNASGIVFSTVWQKDIFVSAYGLQENKISIIENYYGPKEADVDSKVRVFVASTRSLKWKNISTLTKVFDRVKEQYPHVELFTDNLPFERFMNKVKDSYAVIQVSLGDISPNMILDAIRYNRPFICTKEVGIFDRIKDAGVFVDPLNEGEIYAAVVGLLDGTQYESARIKVRQFSFLHSWEDIAKEYITLSNTI